MNISTKQFLSAFLTIVFGMAVVFSANAQDVVVDDFEGSSGLTWTPFSAGTGASVTVIANPDMSGINTSANVLEVVMAADRKNWGGAQVPYTLTTSKRYLHFKVYKSVVSPMYVKLVGTGTGTESDTKCMNDQTKTNEWEDMVVDFSDGEKSITKILMQLDKPMTSAEVMTVLIDDVYLSDNAAPEGAIFTELMPSGFALTDKQDTQISLSWDAIDGAVSYTVSVNGVAHADATDITATTATLTGLEATGIYTVSLVAKNASAEMTQSSAMNVYMPQSELVIEDFESGSTSFVMNDNSGSTASAEIVDNPLVDGINTSSKVFKLVFPEGGRVSDWAGIKATTISYDVDYRYMHVKLLKTTTSVVRGRYNAGPAAQTNIESINAQSLTGEWEDFVIDMAEGDKNITFLAVQPDVTSTFVAQDIYIDDIVFNNDVNPVESAATDISEPDNSEVIIYPNPANDILYVSNSAFIDSDLDIYNIQGKKVLTVTNSNVENGINLTELQKGFYIMKYSANGISFAKQFIKK